MLQKHTATLEHKTVNYMNSPFLNQAVLSDEDRIRATALLTVAGFSALVPGYSYCHPTKCTGRNGRFHPGAQLLLESINGDFDDDKRPNYS